MVVKPEKEKIEKKIAKELEDYKTKMVKMQNYILRKLVIKIIYL